MEFRDAIEKDAHDLRGLADRAAAASGHADLLPLPTVRGNDWLAQERQLESAAMGLRRAWLGLAHRPADATLKSPREGQVARVPCGAGVSFGYEREIDASLLERRGSSYVQHAPGWSSDVVLFRSGQAALTGLLHYAITHWGRSEAPTIVHAGAYFETAALLDAWPQRALHQVPIGQAAADVVLAEPIWCDGAFSCTAQLPPARRAVIVDSTMAGPGYDVGPLLERAGCSLVIVYSSGLKLDQAGLELAAVGIVRIFGRDGGSDATCVAKDLRGIRGLLGVGLTLDELSALSAPWFMDREHADRYVGAVFAHNRALAKAIGDRSPVFGPRCHPSMVDAAADAPFCALTLNDPSPEKYRELETTVALECERRGLLATLGGSFGFRGHRFQLIEPAPGQGETFLRVAMGWRDGWSRQGLCELFAELARQGR